MHATLRNVFFILLKNNLYLSYDIFKKTQKSHEKAKFHIAFEGHEVSLKISNVLRNREIFKILN